MDKSDSHLRILTTEYKGTDEVTWTSTFDRKIYVLEIPTTPGHMILVGKSEDLLDEDSYYIGASLFSEDKAYVFGDEYGDKKNEFAVVDLSNDLDPSVIGSLKVRLDNRASAVILFHTTNSDLALLFSRLTILYHTCTELKSTVSHTS
jgi:uncharacterized secreted protein with C-terminal beta-propeller domain